MTASISHPMSEPASGTTVLSVIEAVGSRLPVMILRKGEQLFSEGDPPEAAFYLKSGLIRISRSVSADDVSTFDMIGPGHLFGMIALLDNKPYPIAASAVRESRVVRIPSGHFHKLMQSNGAFREEVFREIARHLRFAQLTRALMREPAKRRVAKIMSILFEALGPNIPLAREDIAQMAGCTVSTAVRAIISLRKDGIVNTGWKRISLRSRPALNALLNAR